MEMDRIVLTGKLANLVSGIAKEKGIRAHRMLWGIVNGYRIRREINLTPKLEAWLTEVAKELNISVPQLIVRAVNSWIIIQKAHQRQPGSQEPKPQNHDPWA